MEYFVLHTKQIVKLHGCGYVFAGEHDMIEGFDCEGHFGEDICLTSMEVSTREQVQWRLI